MNILLRAALTLKMLMPFLVLSNQKMPRSESVLAPYKSSAKGVSEGASKNLLIATSGVDVTADIVAGTGGASWH